MKMNQKFLSPRQLFAATCLSVFTLFTLFTLFALMGVASPTAFAQSPTAKSSSTPKAMVKAAEAPKTNTPPNELSAAKADTVSVPNMRKDKKIVIRLSHVTAADSVKQIASLKFKENLEARFPGRVVVEVYPNNTLYRDREEMEALQLGVVEMIIPAIGKLSTIGASEFEVFDLPFLFPSEEKLHEVQDGEIGKNMGKGLEKHGLKLLAYWDNGFKSFSSKQPIATMKDFAGQRFRIQSKSAILTGQMEVLGVKPIPMAFADVVQGFKDNSIEGAENPLPNLLFMNMYKEQKHLLLTEHGYLGYVVLMNNTYWSRLPEDIKAGIEAAMKETTAFERNYSKTDDARALEIIKKGGLNVIKPDAKQLSEFKNAMVVIHENFMKTPNKDILVSIYKLVNPDLVKSMEARAAAAKLAAEKKAEADKLAAEKADKEPVANKDAPKDTKASSAPVTSSAATGVIKK